MAGVGRCCGGSLIVLESESPSAHSFLLSDVMLSLIMSSVVGGILTRLDHRSTGLFVGFTSIFVATSHLLGIVRLGNDERI
jgi:hypothetical protein